MNYVRTAQKKRVSHVDACPIAFILFYERSWQEEVLRFMKNDQFLVFLAVWVLFPMFMGRLMYGWSIIKLHEMIKVLHVVACPIIFTLFDDIHWQGRVLKLFKRWSFFSVFSCLSFLFCFIKKIGREEYSKLWKMIIF